MVKYLRSLSSLSADDLVRIERAGEACGILPGLLVECVLRHDFRIMPAVQWRRLQAYLADESARRAYESIFAEAAAAEELRAFVLRDHVTPAEAEQTPNQGGDPLAKSINDMSVEDIVAALDDRLEAERPGQYQFEIDLPEQGHMHLSRTVKRLSRR